MLSLIVLIALVAISIALDEPKVIELFDNDRIHLTIDYCPITITDPDNGRTLVTFTGRCHCQYDPILEESFDCSSPGPTFLFHPGTTVHMTWYNIFIGSESVAAFENSYRDISVYNIHTHGFHISPYQDDVTFGLNPGTTHTYTYTIPTNHYPDAHIHLPINSLHHIHPHHHGSTSWYIHSGAFSAAIIEYEDQIAAIQYDANLLNMRQTLVIASSIYGVDESACNCNGNGFESLIENVTPREEVWSYCFEYCSFPANQRNAENYDYDMQSTIGNEFRLYLINGQLRPVVDDMVANRWRRIRFLNIMNSLVLQMTLPTDSCQWFLLALDGIFLRDNEPRDLSRPPYNGQFVLPPAGRADFAVSCSVGTFSIVTSNANVDPELSVLPRIEPNVVLFTLRVNAQSSVFRNLEGNDVTTLPVRFPNKPSYLVDLTNVAQNQISGCDCSTFGGAGGCIVGMRAQGGRYEINRVEYNQDVAMQSLQKDAVYDFELSLGGHIYHQHIYPFQLVDTVNTGILGLAGDYMDTIGSGRTAFVIRTGLFDFSGKMMVHCHNLPHEDEGMMAFYDVFNQLDTNSCSDQSPDILTPNPTFQPFTIGATDSPTAVPTNPPSKEPTNNPTAVPSPSPSVEPTSVPTNSPTTLEPTTSNPTTAQPVSQVAESSVNLVPVIISGTTASPTTTSLTTNEPTTALPTSAAPTLTSVTDTCCECTQRGPRGVTGCSEDPLCESIVCERFNQRCCSRRWNQGCANEAQSICDSVLPQCCDCLIESNNRGCNQDIQCQRTICDVDPFCCSSAWDNVCVHQATAVCNGDEIPSCCACTLSSTQPGCSADAQCESLVCNADSFCCGLDEDGDGVWDSNCVQLATDVCNGQDISDAPV